MDKIFGNKPATHPKVTIDSIADAITLEAELSDSDIDENIMSRENDPDYPGTSTSTATVDIDDGNEDVKSQKDIKPLVSGKMKRRRQIEVLQDSMKSMINEVVEAQKASDQLFADLEEKRMKMEEAQQERAAKMHQDDQEFQLRVFQLLLGYHMSQPPPMYPPYSGNP